MTKVDFKFLLNPLLTSCLMADDPSKVLRDLVDGTNDEDDQARTKNDGLADEKKWRVTASAVIILTALCILKLLANTDGHVHVADFLM